MKKIVSLFFFLCYFLSVSQPNAPKFISIGTSNSNERSSAIYVKPDGSYFIGGMKNDSALVMYSSNTDAVIWAKTFKFQPVPCYANYLTMTSDGYLIGTASCLNGSSYYCCYFKINPANGNFIWNNRFNSNSSYLSRIIEKNVNEYICMGIELLSGTHYDNKNIVVSASAGAILSQLNCISYPSSNSPDEMQAPGDKNPIDGTFFSSGRSYVQVGINKMRATLIKYNVNGNSVWHKYLHKSASGTSRMYPGDLIFVSPTQLLLMYHADDNCSGACADYYPGMILMDTSGTVIWDKQYNISASNSEYSEKINVIGNRIYLSGYTNINTPNNANVFVLKTDMSGNIIACNQYGSSTLNEKPFINNISNAGDNKNNLLYFTYAAENPNTGLSDINVLKLDTSLQLPCYPPTPLAVSSITFAPFSTSFPPQFTSAPFTTAANTTYNTNFPNPCPANYTRSVTVVSILANDTIINVYNSNATSYYWYSNGSTTPTIQIIPSAIADSVMIYSGCCPIMKRVFYFNFCTPPAINISVISPSVNCGGSTASLIASGANTYTWFNASGSLASGNIFTVNPFVTTLYWVVGAAATGCTNQALATVSVPTQAQANFTFIPFVNTFSITCANPTIQISTSNAALNYTWSSLSSFPLTGTVNTFNQTNVGTWTVTGVNQNSGCTETHTLNIVENTTPPVVASLTPILQTINCSNPVVQTITATAQSPTLNITHSFFSPYPAGNVNITNTNPAIYGGGIGTYTYVLTNNENGCSVSPIIFSIFASQGTPTFQVSSTGTLSNHGGFTVGCSNHSLTVLNIINANSTPVPGGALSYSFFAPGGNLYSQNQTTVVSTPGTWTACVLSIDNNCYLTVPVTIVQNTISPNISAIVPTQILTCFTPSVTLTAQTTNSAATFEWNIPGQQNLQVASLTINTIIPISNTSAGIFTLVITNQDNGCVSNSIIPVQQNLFTPAPKISVTQNLITCVTPTMQLSNSSVTGILNSTGFQNNMPIAAVLWQGPSPQIVTELVSSYVAAVPGIYSMTVRDENNGCYSHTAITIGDFRVYPIITSSATVLDCGESSASISVSVSPTEQLYSYNWQSGGKLFVSGTNTTSILKAMELGTYTVIAINNSNGCSKTDIVSVIKGTLTGNFTADKTIGCAPLQVTFKNNSISSLNNHSITSVWSFGNGTSQTQTNISDSIFTEYKQAGTYNVTLYTAKGDCKDTDALLIKIDIPTKLEAPNIFTPNGDGVNDIFFLKTSNLSEIKVIIFDRWGQLVYETLSETGNIAWDGKNLQGKESAAGVYFYIISAKSNDCEGEGFERRGTITLLR